MPKSLKHTIFSRLGFSKLHLLLFISVFACVGGLVLLKGHAAGSSANIWVDTDGGTCIRSASPTTYDTATACGTIAAAWAAAQPGDLIIIKGGTYSSAFSANGAKSSTVTITAAIGENPWFAGDGNLNNVTNMTVQDERPTNAVTGAGISDGLTMGLTYINGTSGNINFKNIDVWCQDQAPWHIIQNSGGQCSAPLHISGVNGFSMTNGSVGPTVDCTAPPDNNPGCNNSTDISKIGGCSTNAACSNITFDHDYFHDTKNCCGSAGHTESWKIDQGQFITFKHSSFVRCTGCNTATVFFSNIGGPPHDVLMENNFIDSPNSGDSIQVGYQDNPTNFTLRYNSLGSSIRFAGVTTLSPVNLVEVGNIAWLAGYSGCDTGDIRYNVWFVTPGTSTSTCGLNYKNTNQGNSVIYVNPGVDFHLKPGSLAIGAGDPADCPADDIDGDARPVGICDAGADEYVAPANVFVSTSGNDTTCVRGDQTKPCASFQKAYNLSQCGDTIGVNSGTYNNVEIDSNGSSCTTNTTFIPLGGQVTITSNNGNDALKFGGSCKCSTNKPPNHITFDGGSGKNFHTGVTGVMGSGGQFGQVQMYADYDTLTYPSYITLTNMVIANTTPDPGGNGTIGITSGQHITISHNQVGPVCCGVNWNGTNGSSPSELIIGNRSENQVPNSHSDSITVSDNVFLGETYKGSTDWPSSLGSPPQSDCTDTNACHADAVHVVGGTNLTFLRNKFYNSRAQTLFFESIQGPVRNVTIENNYLDTLNVKCSMCANDNVGGNWLIAFNTGNAGIGFDGTTYEAGTTLTMTGNYAAFGQQSCSFSGVTTTYKYNVWTNSSGCDPTDKNAAFSVSHLGDWGFSPPDNNVNYDLVGGSPAIDYVPSATCTSQVSTDLYGSTRPAGTACDAGAFEYGSSSSGGASTGDLNGDGHVTILDLSILLSHYGTSGTASQGDCNNDGTINILDLSILLSHYGT